MEVELTNKQWHDIRFALRLIIRHKHNAHKSELINDAIKAIVDKDGKQDVESQLMFRHYYIEGWGITKIVMNMYYEESTVRKHIKKATEQFAEVYDGGHLLKMFME
ncbi:hypothetical protein RT41_GL000550 [Lactococcus fujiensis JCM 16395]|uniref:Phage protein n=3 Tax=Lactococcus fujiensis TaxID=610251 RepID=A0A2A5RIS5_9LACT|nr:hypothetical protein RT41_GL000550 [Lactococcus fujiensis JCM 16395]